MKLHHTIELTLGYHAPTEASAVAVHGNPLIDDAIPVVPSRNVRHTVQLLTSGMRAIAAGETQQRVWELGLGLAGGIAE